MDNFFLRDGCNYYRKEIVLKVYIKNYIMTTYKKLLRSRDRWIAGVCGGLANYFGWDPALVRIGYLLLSLCSAAFPGLLIYIILWICMPQES